jgi:hypothetical protein
MGAPDALWAGLSRDCSQFPDKGRGETACTYTMADVGLSGFALFFMQSEPFLSHQRQMEKGRGTSNCQTMFGAMNLLAFAFHTVADCVDDVPKAARVAKGSRKRFFEYIRTITVHLVFSILGRPFGNSYRLQTAPRLSKILRRLIPSTTYPIFRIAAPSPLVYQITCESAYRGETEIIISTGSTIKYPLL